MEETHGRKSPGNDSTMAHSSFQRVGAKAAAATLGRTTRIARVEMEEAKGEVNAETHPGLYRVVSSSAPTRNGRATVT